MLSIDLTLVSHNDRLRYLETIRNHSKDRMDKEIWYGIIRNKKQY